MQKKHLKKRKKRQISSYDTMRFDEEDLLELDEEQEFMREDADLVDDEDEEDEEEEEPIEDLAESLDGDTWDCAGSEVTLTEEPAESDESAEEEDLLSDEQVRDFTQEFEKIPEDIADLEAGEPAPKEFDAYEDDDDFYDEEDDEPEPRAAHDRPVKREKQREPQDKEKAPKKKPRRGVKGRARKGKAGKPVKKESPKAPKEKKPIRLTAFEWIAVATSGLLVVAAVSLGLMFTRLQKANAQAAAFSEIGADLADLKIIGESGLIAMRDASALRLAQSSMEEIGEDGEFLDEEEAEEIPKTVEISVNLTSIKSDLKIKFVNSATGKLVANVPFTVTVKSPGGEESVWNDHDTDGIIYKSGVAAGTWSVTPQALDEKYSEQYILSTKGKTISVKDKIEYKKVDVTDEIKKESQVNVAVEDTEPKEATAVESVNVDTVEWVESSKEEVGSGDGTYSWQEVQKADIAAPSVGAGWSLKRIMKLSATEGTSIAGEGGGQEGTGAGDPTTGATASESGTGASAVTDASTAASAAESASSTQTSAEAASTASVAGSTAAAGDSSSAAGTAGSTAAGTAGSTAGTAGSTAGTAGSTAGTGDSTKRTLTLTPATVALFVGGNASISPKQSGFTNPTYTYRSSDAAVATVSDAGVVKGVKKGKATITVTAKEGDREVSATCEITVGEGGTLKTKSGETVFVKEGDRYREATASDYATASTFYLRSETKRYVYHGWQTIDGHTYYFDKNGNYVTGDQVILGVKYHFGSDGVLSSGSGALGVDVSKWNGKINWNAVKNSGVSYAIIRCGYRGTSTGVLVEDSSFRTNMQGALNAGLKVGVYFYSAAVNDVEAVEEASMAAALCSGYRLTYPIFLDVERSSSGGGRSDNIGTAARTAVIKAFCATVANSGYKAGLYANKNWMEGMIDTPSLTNYKLWLAQYAAAPTYTRTRYDMWQYTSKGSIGGISGSVDLNVSYLGY
ncbi:MAG: Ig-like domain-containing protein [Lachnospiraceae bacterium]|nr:Ig-like domain-containing protein [Lachnospiraceae bacterium]